MAVKIAKTLDELQLEALQDEGYTDLLLYYSDTPDGTFSDSGVSASQTLAEAVTAGLPYYFTWNYAGGNPAQYFKIIAYDGASSYSSTNDAETFHGGGGTTLTRLRQLLIKLTRTGYTGTLTSNGSTSTAICAEPEFARRRDDYFGGGGTGAGGWIFYNTTNDEWAEVTDWVQSTTTFTLSPATATSNDSGDTFEVFSKWTPTEMREAINWAISTLFPQLSKPVIDYSFLSEDDRFLYDVPNNMYIVNKVEIESNTYSTSGDYYTRGQPWSQIPFGTLDDGLQRQLEFKHELRENARIRVTGTAPLSLLSSNSSYTEVLDPQTELIVTLAATRLWSILPSEAASSDIQRYQDRMTFYGSMHEQAKKKWASRRAPKRLWNQEHKGYIL